MKSHKLLQKVLAVILFWTVAVSLSGQAPEDLKKTVDANSCFAIEMYRVLAADEGNLFFSPLSISMAFSLLNLGAAGHTAEQIRETFHFDSLRENMPAAFAAILASLEQIDNHGSIDISVDNALWLQEYYPIQEDIISLVRDSYGTEIFPVDYGRNSKKIFRKINRYAREKSRGMIPSVLEEPLSPDSLLTLLNIIYFKGEWRDKFKKSETLDRDFHVTTHETREAKIMHQKNEYDYVETAEAQIIVIPYADNLLSMVIFLPRETDGLHSLEGLFTADNLSRSLSAMKEELVDLYLPRFEIMNEFDLKPPLGNLGTTHAFDPHEADFELMNDPPVNQYIDFARHGAAVKVNESGSEATAVTSSGGCFPEGTPVITADGLKPIEEIALGTKVAVYDISNRTWTQAQVQGIQCRNYRGDMVSIKSGNTIIDATGNHPFYVLSGSHLESRKKPEDISSSEPLLPGSGRWVEARELQAGDVLMDQTDGGLVIDALWTAQKNQPVYNLSVDKHHNYAVTERAVLVHNKGSEETRGISFFADHPFAFLIRENRTGTILFMGRLMYPGE